MILRRSDLAALLDEQRRAIIAEVGQLLNPAPAKPVRLVTADQMARGLAMSRSSFFRLLRQHPEINALRQGACWPIEEVKRVVGAMK